MKYRFIIVLAALFGWPAWAFSANTVNTIVAVVNDEVILSTELDDKVFFVEKQMRSRGTRPPPDNVLRQQVLDRLILETLQLQLAKRQGIRISDEMLNNAVEKIAQQNNMNLTSFKRTLEEEGFDFGLFRENIRNQIIISRLQQHRVNDRITITDQEVENFMSTQAVQGNIDDEYHLAHILVSIPESASPEQIAARKEEAQKILEQLKSGKPFAQVAIAQSDGQNALEGGDLGWRKGGELPTPFVPVVTNMKKDEFSDIIRTPSGFHIVKLMNKRGGPKHVITQHHVKHILMEPSEIMSEREVLLRLEEIKQRLENGADFAELAKTHSQDKTSAGNGGDLGWVSPGSMVPAFDQVMKNIEPNTVSEPFKTRFGWHIVTVVKRRHLDNTDEFERSKARELIRERKFSEELQSWLRQLRDEAYVDVRLDHYIKS